ncbi:MAG: hypothetical protein LBL26_09995 [Peptococcaceae bacterium]|nr:hypothetical protein [Peptococcaceae bacterium]
MSDDLEPWQRLFLGGEMKDSDPSWIKKIYGMLSEVNYTKEELEEQIKELMKGTR